MSIGLTILMVASCVGLVYVLIAGYGGLVRLAASLFQLAGYAETLQNSPHERLVDSDNTMPVSVIIPDCDADPDIVQTVSEILAADYPEFEVIAICGRVRDGALGKLSKGFGLVEIQQPIKQSVPMQPVRQVFRSPMHPGLIVLDKKYAGRSDALNTGVNISRYPLFVTLQPGARLAGDAMDRIALPFMMNFQVAAVGGLPRIEEPIHGTLGYFQQVEYLQTFPAGYAVPGQKKLPLVAGAFGAFRKKTVIDEGGFAKNTDETELVVRLRRQSDVKKVPGVQMLAEPVYQNQGPRSLGGLFRQRRSWQKQLTAALWRNKGMTFNPRYGRAGMWDIPLHWLFDVIGPVLELLALVFVPVAFGLGAIGAPLFWAFFAGEVLFGMVVSLAAVMSQQIINSDNPSTGRLLRMVGFSLLGNIGYRQLMLLFRVIAMFMPNPDR